jgi:membrane protein required for colicin V production
MTWLDYAVIIVIAGSIGWGIWRGLVRELISLAGWVIAFLAANLFAAPVAEVLPEAIKRPELRTLIGYVVVFLGVLIVTTGAAVLLAKIMQAVGLGSLDRTLGGLFGLLRGLIIVVAFALAAGLTAAPRQPFWRNSATGSALEGAALALKPWLPPAFGDRLKYN